MSFTSKRFLAFLLALALVAGLFPAAVPGAAAVTGETPDYTGADAVFAAIEAAEAAPATRSITREQKTEAAKAIVLASDNYVEGSLEENGSAFTWMTEEGIRCGYNPRMRQIREDQDPEASIDAAVNVPRATKNGSPSGNQVYLIGPYYGSDENFTNQYKNEARRVAQAIGDTDGYTLYSGSAATIDKVAEAVSNGAVVFFDSHGTTDYENPNDEYDFITGATNSYLCLSTNYGLTKEDYADGAIYEAGDAYVNGAVIANHMTKNSPSGILWMAICLGMGTDTLYAPLREMGVEVVYGYSESVSFDGDYLFEEAFWDEMTQGKTVAQSVATMKATWGDWDWSVPIAEHYGYDDGYVTIAEARDDFIAFPVVVSDQDTFPGKRTAGYKETNGFYGADTLQTVQSTYAFSEITEVTDPTDPKVILEEAYALSPGEELPYEVTLTGTVTAVTTAYSSYYGNVTVIMEVSGCEDMPIKCYRLSGDGADMIGVGDTITVTGTVVNYQHSSGDTEVEFTQGCLLVSYVSGSVTDPTEPADPTDPTEPADPTDPTEPADPSVSGSATLYFDDKANRVSWDASYQLWEQNGVTALNEKASSSNDVADYFNPVRLYKNSSLTVSAENMVKIEFNCASTSYCDALAVAIPTENGVTAQVSGSTVTVTLAEAADSFCIPALSGGQVRLASITVCFAEEASDTGLPGDLDGNGAVTTDDAVQLLLHISMPDLFPLEADTDLTGDGAVTTDDAVRLLLHISMPDMFPLNL